MRRAIVGMAALGLVAVGGCSLDRSGIGSGGGGDVDGDVSSMDAAIDAYVPPGVDSGPGVDAYVPPGEDGGPPTIDAGCVPRCEGAVAIPCSGARMECDLAGASCAAGTCTGGACAGPACSADGSEVLQCPGGVPAPAMHCDRGCDAGACRPEVGCGLVVDATMTTGTMRFDLCGAENDAERSTFWGGTSGPCPYASDGFDRIVRLDVDRAGHYLLELTDVVGDGRDVDPVLYARYRCNDTTSELGCDDDVSGSDYDSRLELDLEPGEYFVVVDSIDPSGSATGCGQVDLSITRS